MNGYYLFNQSCYSTCPSGLYSNTTTKKCEACHSYCVQCNGPTSANCSSCNSGFYLKQPVASSKTCIQTCSSGQYGDVNTKQCVTCHSNCQSCFDVGNTACYVCNAPYYLEGTTCSSVCPDGKYNNSATKLCEPCASICLTCTGPDISQCTSCIDNYRLINSATCAPVCGSYYYENTTDY